MYSYLPKRRQQHADDDNDNDNDDDEDEDDNNNNDNDNNDNNINPITYSLEPNPSFWKYAIHVYQQQTTRV